MGTENIRTNTSARLFIGPASSAKTLAQFEAIVTAGDFVEIGLIEDMGEFGDESSMQMANPVGEGRQIPIKGSRNAGTQNLVVYQDLTDEGQLALIAAEKSPADFAFHFIDTDVPVGGGTPSERFYRAKVSSVRENRGNNDNIVRRTFALGITTEILLVPADATP